MRNLAHNCTVEVKNIPCSIPPVHSFGSINPGRFRRLCVHDSPEDFHHGDFPSDLFFEECNEAMTQALLSEEPDIASV